MRPVTPTIRNLMDDAIFRAYMKKVPSAHHANTTGKPWQVWVRTTEGRWRTGQFPTYRDAWPVLVKAIRSDEAADACITSRRVFYAPPGELYRVRVKTTPTLKHPDGKKIETRWRQTFFWDDMRLEWCGRCRRPSYWMPLHDGHHALKKRPAIAPDDNLRCIYCGIRKIAQPKLEEMQRVIV